MALLGSTFTQYDASGNREDLSDIIYNISPMETPFASGIGRTKASNVLHEWQTDSLAAASSTNAHLEGDQSSGSALTAPSRVTNRCQILKKTIVVSGTQRAMNHAGMADAYEYYTMKSGKELKRDVEAALLSSNPKTAGSTATARLLGGLGTWLSTNKVDGSSGTTGTVPGQGATVVTGGTQTVTTATMVQSRLDTVIQQAWTSGGDPTVIMCPASAKQWTAAMTGVATNFRNVNQGAQAQIVGGVDVYVSNFGSHKIVPNRFQPEGGLFVLDMNYFAIAELRPMMTEPLAKVGDSDRAHILTEVTLEAKNEASSGQVRDLQF